MTRRRKLRDIARAYAFDATFGKADVVGSLFRAQSHARTKRERKHLTAAFFSARAHFAGRYGRALIRAALRDLYRSGVLTGTLPNKEPSR